MNIAIISKLWEETSQKSEGGTGVAVGILADGLVAHGHKVTLFATGNSDTSATVVSVREEPWGLQYSEPIEYLHLAEAFSQHRNFDIIDCHVEEKACFFADLVSTPSLINVTYGEFGDEHAVFERYKHLNYVSVSHKLQEVLPFLNWRGVIYHGIDATQFSFNESPQDYLLFLGRMSPQKGPHIAIQVAKQLNKKLIMAGKMSDTDAEYLDSKIKPNVDGTQIQYVGVADFTTKIDLYKNALALLHPVQYVEAFGLTLIESMACGTPVISFDNGSPREIIESGVTGFIVNTEEEMAQAVLKLNTISRAHCRKRVETYFRADQMVQQYEEMYHMIINERHNEGEQHFKDTMV